MASSIPDALDHLVQQIAALPEAAPPVVVSDGWPAERGDAVVAVGINPEEEDSSATVTYSQLDGMDVESVEIPSIIAVRRTGSDAASRARTAAFALYDVVRELIRTDRRLGGAVKTGMPVRISRFRMSQTAEPREAGDGRWCEIRWTLAWEHRG